MVWIIIQNTTLNIVHVFLIILLLGKSLVPLLKSYLRILVFRLFFFLNQNQVFGIWELEIFCLTFTLSQVCLSVLVDFF